ncbi:MAG: hypothetical protein PHR53_08540 [Bacteroidales bacterium]|nr:hypothetical protein [Bacteroidales bacterium]
MNTKKYFTFIIRLLIGVMFITTAILKLISLDQLELYIYSFHWFSFVFSTVVARSLIAVELLLGVFLLLKIFYHKTWCLTMLTMIGFTLFLVYAAVFRNDSNCHCFGELIEIDPAHSIIKNIITIVLLLFIRKESDYRLPYRKWIVGGVVAASLIVPFIVFPMDMLYNKFVSEDRSINTEVFEQAKTDSTFWANLVIQKENLDDSIIFTTDSVVWNIDSSSYLMCFVASGCPFCKLGLNKIHLIVDQHNIDPLKVKIIIWGGEKSISSFIKETETFEDDYYLISPKAAINIVFGKFPTFIWMKDGKLVQSGDFRSIDEKAMVEFLQ